MSRKAKHYLPDARINFVRPAKLDTVQTATGVRCNIFDSEGHEQVLTAPNDGELFGKPIEIREETTRIQRGTLTLTRMYVQWPSGVKLWHDSADLEELV